MRPTRCIHGAVLVIYFLNGWIVGENVETNTRLPHYDGRIDATLSAFITSARARSDILGVWVVVLLIIAGAATQVSTLFVASRALYGMSVICSGRHNGTNDIDEDSTRLDFMWSKLSRKSRYHVPQCSVLVSTLLPAILMLTQALRPDSMDRVSVSFQQALIQRSQASGTSSRPRNWLHRMLAGMDVTSHCCFEILHLVRHIFCSDTIVW